MMALMVVLMAVRAIRYVGIPIALAASAAGVATSLVHDLAASLALPGAVGGRLLVLLDILIGHVAVGSDDAVATTSTVPLLVWRKVLLLVHTVYTGASGMHLPPPPLHWTACACSSTRDIRSAMAAPTMLYSAAVCV